MDSVVEYGRDLVEQEADGVETNEVQKRICEQRVEHLVHQRLLYFWFFASL